MKTRIGLTRVGYSRKELNSKTRTQTESRRVKVKCTSCVFTWGWWSEVMFTRLHRKCISTLGHNEEFQRTVLLFTLHVSAPASPPQSGLPQSPSLKGPLTLSPLWGYFFPVVNTTWNILIHLPPSGGVLRGRPGVWFVHS